MMSSQIHKALLKHFFDKLEYWERYELLNTCTADEFIMELQRGRQS